MEIILYGTIRDIQNRKDLILVDLSQDVRAIKEYLGNHPDLKDFNGFFVKIHNGDYTEIFAYEGTVPYLDKELWKVEY